jgi:hypothetical protein
VRTRLLVELGSRVSTEPERAQLLHEAVALRGNLIAAAMATFLLKSKGPTSDGPRVSGPGPGCVTSS